MGINGLVELGLFFVLILTFNLYVFVFELCIYLLLVNPFNQLNLFVINFIKNLTINDVCYNLIIFPKIENGKSKKM